MIDDDTLDRQLREAAPYIDDEGFTALPDLAVARVRVRLRPGDWRLRCHLCYPQNARGARSCRIAVLNRSLSYAPHNSRACWTSSAI